MRKEMFQAGACDAIICACHLPGCGRQVLQEVHEGMQVLNVTTTITTQVIQSGRTSKHVPPRLI